MMCIFEEINCLIRVNAVVSKAGLELINFGADQLFRCPEKVGPYDTDNDTICQCLHAEGWHINATMRVSAQARIKPCQQYPRAGGVGGGGGGGEAADWSTV